jgi:lysozyme family protein
VPADGDAGEVTLHALDGFRQRRGAAGEAVLLKAVECLQGARYIAIAEANPKQEAFEYGWLDNRVGLH